MALGDLYLADSINIFRRDVSDGTWSIHNTSNPSNTAAGMEWRDDKIYVCNGSSSIVKYSVLDGTTWTDHNVTAGQSVRLNGITLDLEGTIIFVANSGPTNRRLFKWSGGAASNFSPSPPSTSLVGISMKTSDGTLAICTQTRIWELAQGGNTWTQSDFPQSTLANSGRTFSSVAYDHNGDLWVYSRGQQRFYKRTGSTWAADFAPPTLIGTTGLNTSFLSGVAYEQAEPAVTTGLMNVKLGDANINDVKFGTEDVSAVYLGTQKIWG